ncbi:MAG: CPXCG motif-containing cysteine-rich protein [Gammaproteobacteria bacterium]
MDSLQSATLQCPYCWEQIDVMVDCSDMDQEYVEDCSVCCSPVVISVTVSDGDSVHVTGRMENA